MFTRILRRTIVVTLLCLLTATTALADSKTGEAKFKVGGKDTVKASLTAGQLKFEGEYKLTDFFGKTALSAGGKLKNTSDKKLHYAYNVAFLDKDKNLVACSSLNLSLDPGKETFIGNVIFVPPDQLEKIAFYSVTLYEGEKEIGSK